MKKNIFLLALSMSMALSAGAQLKMTKTVSSPDLTVLETKEYANGHAVQVVSDAKGRVFKRTLRPDAPKSRINLDRPVKAPRKAAAEVTFYEGFEGYNDIFGLNWIPEGWSKINTEAHTPTEEQIAHNINNSWYVYYSSNFYQEMTPDGESEAFIHFGYNGSYGCTDAAQDEWLVTPEITLGEDETLSFLLQCDFSSIYTWDFSTMQFEDRSVVDNTMQVMLTDDGGQNWTCLWDLEADVVRSTSDRDCYYTYGDMMYHNFETSLAEYAGKTVKVAFRYIRREGWCGNSMMIDGVTVSHPGEGGGDDDGWKLLGTGTMADGWVIPALTKSPGEFYNPEDYLFDVVIYESNETPGVYKLKSPYTSAAFPFIDLNANTTVPYDIIIDASNPEFVTVAPQISGFEHNDPGTKADRYKVPYYISNAGTTFAEDYPIADVIVAGFASTFDPESGVITITHPQYGHIYGDRLDMGFECSEEQYPSVITLPGKAPQPTWTNIGKGTWVDGFLYSGYLGNPKGHGWEVEIEESADKPGLYRMVNPYTVADCPLQYFNANTADTYVVIDATDPEIVVLQPQFSGFSAYTGGELWDFYIGNWVGTYVASGTDKNILLQYLSEEYVDKMANGVVTFKKPLFGSDNYADFGYQWTDENQNPVDWPARLYLPGATETPDPADVEAESITLSQTEYEGLAGETITLTATVLPDDTTDKTVTWTSSDENVATVADGIVTLLNEGTTTITAQCGAAKVTCLVTVRPLSGITAIGTDAAAGQAVYYTPTGIKVSGTPTSGIYIRILNGKATKVIL